MNKPRAYHSDKTIVVKVGSSTLSFTNGRLNLQRMEQLVGSLIELKQQGNRVILVSSGAVAAGGGLAGMKTKPEKLAVKQALAALGQAELMKIYQKFFERHQQVIAQVLLTKDGLHEKLKRTNATNTLRKLLGMGIIPVINENDTVSTYGIEFGNNDVLAAGVAELLQADLLIVLSDIDGLYTADPRNNKDASMIRRVNSISKKIQGSATGSGNTFGTGGMEVKLQAAEICLKNNIDMVIANGQSPDVIHDIVAGKEVGTLFTRDTNDKKTRNNDQ